MTAPGLFARSLVRAVSLTIVCTVGLYGAGLASLAVHESGHAAATRLVGGRVLRLRVVATLRGGSFVQPYYPFAERTGYFDRYWVFLGGPLSSVALGLLAAVVVLRRGPRWALASAAVVGTTLGAIGVGALRFSITGRPGDAADLAALSPLITLSPREFRWALGSLGVGMLVICAGLVSVGIRRAASAGEERSEPGIPGGALLSTLIASGALGLWYFGIGWSTALILGGFATGMGVIVRRWPRFRHSTSIRSIPIRMAALEAALLVGVGVLTVAAVKTAFPGDQAHPPIPRSPKTVHELRLAAYWSRRMGDSPAAMNYLEEAKARYASAGVLYDLGTAYRLAGRPRDSMEALSEACDREPGFEACWAQLAAAYEQANERKRAAAAWRKAAGLAERDPDRVARSRRVSMVLRRADALSVAASP